MGGEAAIFSSGITIWETVRVQYWHFIYLLSFYFL